MVATVGSISIDLQTNVAKFASGFRSAATTVDRESSRMARATQRAERGFESLALTATRFFAAGFAAREVAQYADAWTEAGNKIRAASEIAGRRARPLEALNDIAAETRSGLTETVDLYAKLLRSTANVAKSELEVARATEIVNKAFKAGGAATSEQIAGILQLSQALGSGVLQGDELRSIRENAPLLAQAIANEFGTTIAGLKALGAEGKITSERVFRAILAAQEPIDAAFAKTNSTIGESFRLLRNEMIEAVGKMDEASGASQVLIGYMGSLASRVEEAATAFENFENNPGVDNFLRILGFKLTDRGESILSGINNVIDGDAFTSDAAEIKAEIRAIEEQIFDLITRVNATGFDLLHAQQLAEDAEVLKQKLAEIEQAAVNAATRAFAAMQRIRQAAEAESMAALEQFKQERMPSVTRFGKEGGGGAATRGDGLAGVTRFGDLAEDTADSTERTAKNVERLDRNAKDYLADLGIRIGGLGQSVGSGLRQINTTMENLPNVLAALAAEGITNPQINFQMAGDNPFGSTLSESRKRITALGHGQRGTGSRVGEMLEAAKSSPRTVTAEASSFSGPITLVYQASPGESEKTSRQRARDMLDELRREAARA